MVRKMVALAAVGTMVVSTAALAADPVRPLVTSYAAPTQMGGAPLFSGRAGARKSNESNIAAGSAILALGLGGIAGGVACHETDLCGSNGNNGSISPN